MTVGMVTARTHGGARARRFPKLFTPLQHEVHTARTTPLTPRAQMLRRTASKAATKRLAVMLLGRASPLPVAAFIAAWVYYNRKVDPPGFPGFDNISPGWRNPVQAPLGYSPGEYIPNPFDHRGAYGDGWEALVDTANCQLPQGCLYWGDFPASIGNPYPDARPGLNWPTVPTMVPTAPLTSPIPAARPMPAEPLMRPMAAVQHPRRHRVLPNLVIGQNDLFWDDGLTANVVFKLTLPQPNQRAGSRAATGFFRTSTNEPAKKQKEKKAKPKSRFIWLVLKRLANALGEAREWIDILAEAAGYEAWLVRRSAGFKITGSRGLQDFTRPQHFRTVGARRREYFLRTRTTPRALERGIVPASIDDGKHEVLRKAFYLFELDGLDNVDFDLLLELTLENEIEDRVFGLAGRASKFSAQGLGLTVGPQTGLVL